PRPHCEAGHGRHPGGSDDRHPRYQLHGDALEADPQPRLSRDHRGHGQRQYASRRAPRPRYELSVGFFRGCTHKSQAESASRCGNRRTTPKRGTPMNLRGFLTVSTTAALATLVTLGCAAPSDPEQESGEAALSVLAPAQCAAPTTSEGPLLDASG